MVVPQSDYNASSYWHLSRPEEVRSCDTGTGEHSLIGWACLQRSSSRQDVSVCGSPLLRNLSPR